MVQQALASLAEGHGPAHVPSVAPSQGSPRSSRTSPTDAPLSSRSVPGWTPVYSASAPPTGKAPAIAYDALDNYVVYFGGQGNGSQQVFYNQTWTFWLGHWSNITATAGHAPPGSMGASMAYDAVDHYLVLFGGYLGCSGFVACIAHASSLTYAFAGGKWTNLTATAGTPPTPRWGAGMSWDGADGEILLFGGELANGVQMGDTWTFVHGAWTDLTNGVFGGVAPEGRSWPAMSFDASSDTVVLFGGLNDTLGRAYSNTWEFHSTLWTNVTASVGTPPQARWVTSMADDLSDGELLLYGGWAAGSSGSWHDTNDTWAFDGSWTNLTSGVHPALGGSGAGVVYDCLDGYVLTASGYLANGSASSGTWSFGVPGGGDVQGATAGSTSTLGAVPFTADFTAGLTGCGLDSPDVAYDWSFGDHGADSHYANPTHEYNSTGTFHVFLNVTLGTSGASAQTNITVLALPPLLVTASSNASTTTVGGSLVFSANATGGSGNGYVYTWEFGDNTTGAGQPITHTFSHQGNGTVEVSAVDSRGDESHTTLPIEVLRDATAPLRVTATANASSTTVGGSLTFRANATGGSGHGYVYSWEFGDNSSGSGEPVAHQFLHQGNGTVLVTVVDSGGHAGHATVPISVRLLREPLKVVATSNRSSTPVGGSITFDAVASGGSGLGYTYLWDFGDNQSATGAQVGHRFASQGNGSVWVDVTDSDGNVAHATLAISVDRVVVPQPLTVVAEVSASHTTEGGVLWFNATAAGGSGSGYEYTWYFGDNTTGAGSSTFHQFTVQGNGTVIVTVVDSAGDEAHAVLTVAVYAAASGPSGGAGPFAIFGNVSVLFLSLVAFGAVAVVLFLALRNRQRRAAASSSGGERPPPPEPEEEEAPDVPPPPPPTVSVVVLPSTPLPPPPPPPAVAEQPPPLPLPPPPR